MLADQFWKILFIALVGTGCWFWWNAASKKKAYKAQVAALAELIDVRPQTIPKNDAEAEKRTFQAVGLLLQMAETGGEDFDPRTPLLAAGEINESSPGLADTLSDILESSFDNAVSFGFLGDEDAAWRLEQGSAPTISSGMWTGQKAAVGYHITPDVNESLANHLANRVLVPEGVRSVMRAGGITKNVDDWAERMKRLQILDLGEREQIRREYSVLRDLSRKN